MQSGGKELHIATLTGIVLLMIVTWCIIQMIKSLLQLNRLKKQNPVVENEVVRDFVYTKPEQITQGSVFDIIGIVNIVDAARGLYEMLIRQGYGGGRGVYQRLASYEGTIMLLQQPFLARYTKDATINETNYFVFQLERSDGGTSPLLKDVKPHIERRIHLLVI